MLLRFGRRANKHNVQQSRAATDGATNPVGGNPSNYIAPVYQYGDAVTWIKGKHAFKGGVEVRLISDAGYDANGVTPNVVLGANGSQPVALGIGGYRRRFQR